MMPSASYARLLEIREGDPLLVERRVINDIHGRRIESTESRYPGDRHALDLRFEMRGGDQDGAP
jgi:DNA-binding GntR family transcriptional regulator